MKTYSNFGIYDFSDFAEELDEEMLFTVNGGTNYGQCGGGASAPTIQPPSPPSNPNPQPTPDIPTSTSPTPTTTVTTTCSGGSDPGMSLSEQVKRIQEEYNKQKNIDSRKKGNDDWHDWWLSKETDVDHIKVSTVAECGGLVAKFLSQRTFSAIYSRLFGEKACAATSLLNELSEQYSRENGKKAKTEDLLKAMIKAVNDNGISDYDAYIKDWNVAANSMAEILGLKGKYEYTKDKTKADAIIYYTGSHFVNDIGNGMYYDPWTGEAGKISDIKISSCRYLDYTLN